MTLTVKTEAGASYTLTSEDDATAIRFTSSSPITVFVPDLGVGFNCALIQDGDGQITLTGSGVTLESNTGSLVSGGPDHIIALLQDTASTTQVVVSAGPASIDANTLQGNAPSAFAAASHTHDAADVTSGTFADARISQSSVTQHQGALSITESQISDLGNYSVVGHTHAAADVTSGTFADARIAQSNVTQHEGAITITESQISDFGSYAASGHNHTLDSLSNVTITANTTGELLQWNGSAWINRTAAEAGLSETGHTHTSADLTDFSTAVDARVTYEALNGNSDVGTGATQVARGNHNHSLDGLSNVTITAIASGEVLKWNGSAWVNNTLAEAGVAAASHNHAAGDITSGTFANARISQGNVTQHQAALSITESQISDLGSYVAGDGTDYGGNMSINAGVNTITFQSAVAFNGTFTATQAVQFNGKINVLNDVDLDAGLSERKYVIHHTTNSRSWELHGDGSTAGFRNNAAQFWKVNPGAALELYYNGTKVVETTSTGLLLAGTGRIQGIDTVSASTDAANKQYVDDAAGAAGGGSDGVFYENDQNVTTDYTITSGKNAMSAGPITINNGVTVTVPSGSEWTVV